MVTIKNQQEILTDLLNRVDSKYEKSIGYLLYDIFNDYSIELENLYKQVLETANLRLVSNLSGDELTQRCYENRGVKRRAATSAKVNLTITGVGTIKKGDLFSTKNNVQFKSLEDKTITNTGNILAECTQLGNVGMVGAGSIIQIPITIQGITGVTNNSSSYDGFDEESDESLKQRYKENLDMPITSNNKAHFLYWAKEVKGVGNARVISRWNGDLTVKVIIIDANMQPASDDLVKEVQNYIDPKGILENGIWTLWGTGYGASSIGNYCTVVSATPKAINIDVDIDMASGYTLDICQTNIANKIASYLKTIAFSETINYISYAKINQLVLESEGVIDLKELKINGATNNITIGNEEVAIVGTVTVK